MSGLAYNAQKGIFDALDGVISATVYDDVPDLPEGMPDSNFPYVVVGDDTSRPWDTDDQLGEELTITLHIWSRYRGMKQVKDIMGEIYDVLHRGSPTATGMRIVDCLFEFADTFLEDDGITRHGVCRYRLTVETS